MSLATFPAADLAPDALRAAVDRDGVAVVTGVLDDAAVRAAREALDAAVDASAAAGLPTHVPSLDPNAANVRVFNLPGLHPHFMGLLADPLAARIAEAVLGEDWIVSNFTANLARPGSGSMTLHSDQGIVVPEPWLERWTVNLIWCLTDARGDNGATRYVPGSHRCTTADALPADAAARLVPFEAPAGSVVVMDGRTWHTSGANVTRDETRALAFAYLTRPFVRPQWNWTAALTPEQQADLDPTLRRRLGLDAAANLGLRDLTPTRTGASPT
jgi:ectoine hydroxylase-related dioxygenase (phytanoyl-CoA dioxygenase family)